MRKGSSVIVGIMVVLTLWAGYIYWRDARFPNQTDAEWFVWKAQPIFSSINKPENIQSTGSETFNKIASSATSAAEQVTKSIDQSIQVSTNSDEPLTEQALNYARYQYCKQVVEEYDGSQGNANSGE